MDYTLKKGEYSKHYVFTGKSRLAWIFNWEIYIYPD